MGLPKNFNKQKPQLQRRLDSLNELNYYEAEYMVDFSEEFLSNLTEEEKTDLYHHFRYDSGKGFKKFTAKDMEMAKDNLDKWLSSFKERGVLSSYFLTEISENSFYEELVDKNLLPLVDDKVFEEIMEKSKMED